MKIPDQPVAIYHQTHTYTEVRQQIHDDLRIQHPEWVERNGESSMALMELLDTLTRMRSEMSPRIFSPDEIISKATAIFSEKKHN
jgi:hypothetical protein